MKNRFKVQMKRRQPIVLMMTVVVVMAISIPLPAQNEIAGALEHEQAVLMGRDGRVEEGLKLLDEVIEKTGGTPRMQSDRAIILSWAKRDVEAIAEFEELPAKEKERTDVQAVLAHSYLRLKNIKKAEELFTNAIAKDSSHADAVRGKAIILIGQSKLQEAVELMENALKLKPDSIPLLYESALTYWHHMRQHVKALENLNQLLRIAPGHPEATNERAKLISDMGAGRKALEFADANRSVITPRTSAYLKNNMAAQHVNWDEPVEAKESWTWEETAESDTSLEGQRKRVLFDRVLAQAALLESDAIIEYYEQLIEDDVEMPFWVHDAAASSYLYKRDTDKAIETYEKTVELEPNRPESKLGLYYALVEAGKFKDAEKVRWELERGSKYYGKSGGILQYDGVTEETILNHGWWLAHQDRLSEAEDFFEAYHRRAPANLAIRTALGHVRYWRGWRDAGLEELSIATTMRTEDTGLPEHAEQNEIAALNGRAMALNAAGYKTDARKEAEQLLERNPFNLSSQAINRAMDIEDSTEFFFDIIFTEEDPGVDEDYVYARLLRPINPGLAAYVFYLNRETTDSPDVNGDRAVFDDERYGVGIKSGLRRDLALTLEISRDYDGDSDLDNDKDEGYLYGLDWQINDVWDANVAYNSFSLDVPIRARAAGVEGKETSAGIRYRTSELFETSAFASQIDLDDRNENLTYGLSVERQLINRAYWKTRLFFDVSQSENSETNVPYFSPDSATTYYIRHMLQHMIWRVRDRAIVHRLHLGAGQFDQDAFDKKFIWDVRYEHDYQITDWCAFLWGVNMRQNYYDAEKTDVISWYITYRQNF